MKPAYWKHFRTVNTHRWQVTKACFKVGLIKQGLLHDLSKYSPVEFLAGAKYFRGNGSPIDREKKEKGFSKGWQHHKGRNKHHWQYWTDFDKWGNAIAVEMPVEYVAEMLCDWVGAGKAYKQGKWTYVDFLAWHTNNINKMLVSNAVKEAVSILTMNIKSEQDIYKEIRTLIKMGTADYA